MRATTVRSNSAFEVQFQNRALASLNVGGRTIPVCTQAPRNLCDARELVDFDLDVLKRHISANGLMRASAEPGSFYHGHVWERDTAMAMRALRRCGRADLATYLGQTWLKVLHQDRSKVEAVITAKKAPDDLAEESGKRKVLQPIREIDEGRLTREVDWVWYGTPQFDGLAYFILEVCKLEQEGWQLLTRDNLELVESLILYLQVMRCWEKDFGAWEQEYDTHASTLHALLRAFIELNTLSKRTGYTALRVPLEMIANCSSGLAALGDWHQPGKMSDMAHLLAFSIGRLCRRELYLLKRLVSHLWHWKGCIRYWGDSYMLYQEGYEARWTLGSLMVVEACLACQEYDLARLFLNHINAVQRLPNLNLPEAYEFKEGKWRVCQQNVLAWSHAVAAIVQMTINNQGPFKQYLDLRELNLEEAGKPVPKPVPEKKGLKTAVSA